MKRRQYLLNHSAYERRSLIVVLANIDPTAKRCVVLVGGCDYTHEAKGCYCDPQAMHRTSSDASNCLFLTNPHIPLERFTMILPRSVLRQFLLLLGITFPQLLFAQQPITLNDVEAGLPDISADEPMAANFSPKMAAEYLDRSALNWQKTKDCATCHTNLFYMVARPALGAILPDSGEVRRFYEDYRKVRWQKNGPTEANGFWPIVVGTGLMMNDLQSTGKLSDVGRDVLDMMWTVQRQDGGWNWPHCDYAPMEIDDHYGVTIAALATGIAPDGYAQSPKVQAGLERMRIYFQNNPPKSLHHRAMLAWCSVRVDGIATEEQRKQTRDELMSLQLPDGGWSTSGFLTDWKGLARGDGDPLDTKTSDGYGTGLVIVIARELGLPADDSRLQRGIQWIYSNQRASGKWFTKSPVNDAGNLISNVGSAYVVLALQSCDKLPGWPFSPSKKSRR